MKKLTIILVTLLIATFANAQITKIWTGNIDMLGSDIQVIEVFPSYDCQIIGNYLGAWRSTEGVESLDIMDASSLTKVKTISIESNENEWGPQFLSKGIFSTDGKWAWLVYVATTEGVIDGGASAGLTYKIITEVQIRNEDGITLATIPYYNERTGYTPGAEMILIKAGNSFRLVVPKFDENNSRTEKYDIYTLPGDGSSQNLITPYSTKHSARKIARDGQVLIETETNTYTLNGQEVK